MLCGPPTRPWGWVEIITRLFVTLAMLGVVHPPALGAGSAHHTPLRDLNHARWGSVKAGGCSLGLDGTDGLDER